jgi:hypothetical protein
MKNVILKIIGVSMTLFMFASCADKTPDSSLNTPGLSTEGNTHMQFQIDEEGHRIGQGVQVLDSVEYLHPTWGQALYYADESGYWLQKLVAILFLLAIPWTIWQLVIGKMENGREPNWIFGISLCAFLAFMYGKPMIVKLNNDKETPIAHYREVVEKNGNCQAIWDDLYNQNRLIGAASKK